MLNESESRNINPELLQIEDEELDLLARIEKLEQNIK